MATRKSKKPYYYAGGKRVVLEPAADLVAVDAARLAEKLPELASDAALRAGKPLRDGIRLVQRATLAPETLQRLRTAGVTQPVFRQGGAVMVALPEIRIEDKGAAKLAAARKFAAGKIQANTGAAEGRSTARNHRVMACGCSRRSNGCSPVCRGCARRSSRSSTSRSR